MLKKASAAASAAKLYLTTFIICYIMCQAALELAQEAAATASIAKPYLITVAICYIMFQGALKLAQEAASAASVAKIISFNNKSCANWIPKRTPTMVVANPPWGIRLLPGQKQAGSSSSSRVEQQQQRGGGRWEQQRWQQQEEIDGDDDLADTWQQLSIFLKQQCPGMRLRM